MIRMLKKFFLCFVISSFGFVSLVQPVQAALIGTEQVATANAPQSARARIAAQLARPEVRDQLEKLGIAKADAEARAAALTDEEAAQLAQRMDAMPAGGEGIIGALVLIFLVLLITDILGFTKIFPFTRPIH